MEIKETNNSIAQMLLGKGGQSQSSSANAEAKGGFANLLNGAATVVEDMMQALSTSKETAPAAKPDTKEVPLKSAQKDKPENKSNNKEAVSAEKNTNKNDKTSKRKDKEVADAAPQQAEKPAEKKDTKTAGATTEAVAVAVVEAEATTLPEVVQEAVVASSQKIQSILEIADKLGFVAMMNEGQMMLVPSEQLQSMDPSQMVQVFDVAQGKTIEMTVADLLAKVNPQNGTMTAVSAEDFVADLNLADFAQKLALLPQAQAPEVAEIVRDFGAKLVQYDDVKLANQAAKLDEKLGGTAISVEVDVEEGMGEEKIAQSTTDLFAGDSVELQEFREAVKTPITKLGEKLEEENKVDAEKTKVADASGAPVNAAQNANAAPVVSAPVVDLKVAALNPQALADADVSAAVAAADDNNAINVAVASHGLKPELAAKAEETSLKDVYKGMAKEAAEQVKVNITKSAIQGVDKIDVRLKPDDLGHVQVKLQISKDGKVQAEIIANRQETMQMLQKEVETLQKALNDAGFEADNGSFSFSFRGEEEQKQQAELRNFIGNVLERESSEEIVSNDNLNWDPAQGLNIRV